MTDIDVSPDIQNTNTAVILGVEQLLGVRCSASSNAWGQQHCVKTMS